MKNWRRTATVMCLLSILVTVVPAGRFGGAIAVAAPPPGKAAPPEESMWREDEVLRTAHSRQYISGDFLKLDIQTAPLHHQDQAGKWQPVDTQVVPRGNGRLHARGGRFEVDFSDVDPRAAVNVKLANGKTLQMGLDDTPADMKSVAASTDKTKFNKKAQGRRVQFSESKGNLEYRYEVHSQGVKEDIILHRFTGKHVFQLPLQLDGLRLEDKGGGSYSILDADTGEPLGEIPPPFGFDAAGHSTRDIDQAVIPTTTGLELWLSVDQDWLKAPERVYPVTIDPSILIAPNGAELTVASIANFEPAPGGLKLQKWYDENSYKTFESVSLIKFSLSSIPKGARVHSATLDVSSRPLLPTVNVFGVTTAWTLGMVTWTSPRGNGTTWAPGGDLSEVPLGNLTAGAVNVTGLVQDWVDGIRENTGFAFKLGANGYEAVLANPSLQVVYALDRIPPTVSLLGTIAGKQIKTSTPISAKGVDSNGVIARMELLVDGVVSDVAVFPPAAEASLTLDPRRISNGTHSLSAAAYDSAGNRAESPPVSVETWTPASPLHLQAIPQSNGASLSWRQSETPGVTYDVYRALSPTENPSAADRIASGVLGTVFEDQSLAGVRAETYYYAVSARDGSGSESRVVGTVAHFPFAPGRPSIVRSGEKVDLSWPASARPGVTYNVYRKNGTLFEQVVSGVTGTSYTLGINRVPNGSFENPGWTPNNGASIDNGTAKFGSKSLKYEYRSNNNATAGPTLTGLGSKTVTISAWSKALSVSGISGGDYAVLLSVRNPGTGSTTQLIPLSFSTGTHDWEFRSKTVTLQSWESEAYLSVYFANHTGTVWFDGIQLEFGSTSTPYQEYVPTAGTQTYRVTALESGVESQPSPETSEVIEGVGPISFSNVGGKIGLTWPASGEDGAAYRLYRKGAEGTLGELIASGLSTNSYVDGVNKLANPGFETQVNGTPAAWVPSSYSPVVEFPGHQGSYSLKMTSLNSSVSQTVTLNQSQAKPVTVSAYSKASGVGAGTGGYTLLASFTQSNGVTTQKSVDFTAGTHDWERQSVTFTPNAPISSVTVSLRMQRPGTAWFDSVQVEEAEEASMWKGGPPGPNPYYRVEVNNPYGSESSSQWQAAQTFGGTPSDVSLQEVASGEVEIRWTPVPGYTYNVQRDYTVVASGLTEGVYRNGRNLLPNPGFEVDTNNDGVSDGWTQTNAPRTIGAGPSGGSGVIKVKPGSSAYQDVPLHQVAAEPITLSGYFAYGGCMGPYQNTSALRLVLLDAVGATIASATSSSTSSCTWTRTSVTVTPSVPATTARVMVVDEGAMNHPETSVDNLQLESGISATSWVDDALAPDITYKYSVVPVMNGSAGAPTLPIPVRLSYTVAPASGTHARVLPDSAVAISWLPATSPSAAYNLYRTQGPFAPSAAHRIAKGVTVTSFEDPGNLLSNTSFEEDKDGDGRPDDWSWIGSPNRATVATTAAKFGAKSLTLSGSHATSQGLSSTALLRQEVAFPVTLSAWSKSLDAVVSSPSDYAIVVTLLDRQGQPVGSGLRAFTSGTHDWEARSVSVTPVRPAHRAVVQVQFKGTATSVAFDGIQLQAGLQTSSWVEGPVNPGDVYTYWVGTYDRYGREAIAVPGAQLRYLPWAVTPSGTLGDAPGLGLDDRWYMLGLPVPGGDAHLNATTGNLVLLSTDLLTPGPHLAQVLRRTYNSQGPAQASALGAHGWSVNAVQTISYDEVTSTATLKEGDGSELRFVRQDDGSFVAPPSVWMTLTSDSSGGWQITRRDGIDYSFDSAGRLVELREPHGYSIQYVYLDDRLVAIRGPATREMTIEYDDFGRMARIVDSAQTDGLTYPSDARAYEYRYDDATGLLTEVRNPLGHNTGYGYDAAGRLTSVTDGEGRKVLLGYDQVGRLVSHQWQGDPNPSRIMYDTLGEQHRTTVTDPSNAESTLLTTSTGNLLEFTNAIGSTTRYEYDQWQRMVKVVNPKGLVTELEYVDEGISPRIAQVIRRETTDLTTVFEDYTLFDQPRSVTDPLGVTTTYGYNDVTGDLEWLTTAANTTLAATTRYVYNPEGFPVKVTDPEGHVTDYEYDPLGQVVSVTNPLGGTIRMRYDRSGNMIAETDPNGNTTSWSYDALGRRISSTNSDGTHASWLYDRSGLLVAETHPGLATVNYHRDHAGRLTVQEQAGKVTQFKYDLAGNQTTVLYPNGSRSHKEYDTVGRVVRQYDGENLDDAGTPVAGSVFTEFAYDTMGNMIAAKLPNGYAMTAVYDQGNRLVQESRPPATTAYTYDAAGRMVTEKDANGKWTRFEYDVLGRLTRVYDAANLTVEGMIKPGATFTQYDYNKLGQRVRVTNALGAATNYQYGPLGKLEREIDPIGQTVTHVYDQAGRLLETEDKNGMVTAYEYDRRNRVSVIRYQDNYRGVSYTYDAAGRRTSMIDALGRTYYAYDESGRLIEETTPRDTIRYEYDALGQRTALILPEGRIQYTYDRANRLVSVTDTTGAMSTMEYGLDGVLRSIRLPGGVVESRRIDPESNRVMSRTYLRNGSTQLGHEYTYDLVGNVTMVRTNSNQTTSYAYDDLYRLLAVYGSGFTTSYKYDAIGNRVREETLSNGSTSYTTYEYTLDGVLTRSTAYASGATTGTVTLYAYDANGNLIQTNGPNGPIRRNLYNSRGELIRSQEGAQTISYYYDGDGRLVRRRIWTTDSYGKEWTTKYSQYQYDGLYLLTDRDGVGTLRMQYTHDLSGRVLAWRSDRKNGAVLVDHLGSVVLMTDSSGSAVNQYEYDTFGKVKPTLETVPNEVRFTGAPLDQSGYYHMGARFYDPSAGRFITQDTYKGDPWRPWTQNLYVYAGNNPVNYVDPTGHWAITVSAGLQFHFGPGVQGGWGFFAVDDEGDVANTLVAGVGGGAEASAGVQVNFNWGADNVEDLAGEGLEAAVDIGVFTFTAGFTFEPDGDVSFSSLGVGLGGGMPLGFHLDVLKTWVFGAD